MVEGEEQEEIQSYLKTVEAARASMDRPWEATKRVTKRFEPGLSTYTGMWPRDQWPDPVALGEFLEGFLSHILSAHYGSCLLCDEWHEREGVATAIWPAITVPIPVVPCSILRGVRLVERTQWEVTVEANIGDFTLPGRPRNAAREKSFPRLTVYGRYGIEQIPEEKHNG